VTVEDAHKLDLWFDVFFVVQNVQSSVTWAVELVLRYDGSWWIHLAYTQPQPAASCARLVQRWDNYL